MTQEDVRGIAGARVAPDAAVQPEDDESQIAGDEHRRQGDVEEVAHPRRALTLHADRVRGGERAGDEREVHEHLHESPAVHDQRAEQRCRLAFIRGVVDIREVGPEFQEERERQEDSGERDIRVVEDVVGEAVAPSAAETMPRRMTARLSDSPR